MSWYYASNQQQLGPLTDEELNQKIASGEITPSTLVWQDGMTDWKPLSEVKTTSTAATPFGSVLCLCGNTFPQSETVKIGDRWVCPACKDTAIQLLKEGVATGGSMRYAGFWIRFAAKIIDGIILAVVNVPLGIVSQLFMTFSAHSDNAAMSVVGVAVFIVSILVQLALQAGYTIYFTGKKGATPGKMLCRLKVVRADGSALTYRRATGRFFAEWVTGLTCTIGYIMAGFDEEKRSLHDRIADTRVIQQS